LAAFYFFEIDIHASTLIHFLGSVHVDETDMTRRQIS